MIELDIPALSEARERIAVLEAEIDRLRKALEVLPHEPTCYSVTSVHKRGYTYFETDAGTGAAYHWEPKGPCNCVKAALKQPELQVVRTW